MYQGRNYHVTGAEGWHNSQSGLRFQLLVSRSTGVILFAMLIVSANCEGP